MNRRLLAAVGENVLVPVGTYGALVLAGVPAVWALVGSAGVSALIVALGYRRTGRVSTLGSVVGVRFLLAIAVAAITGDARLVLAKDAAVTAVIAVGVAVTLSARRPFIAGIRRDLSGDPAAFDARWAADAGFRAAHRRVTLVWTAGLLGEAGTGLALAYGVPIDVAVVVSQVVGLVVLLGLIAWTQRTLGDGPVPRRANGPVGR